MTNPVEPDMTRGNRGRKTPGQWKDKAKQFLSYFSFIEKAGTALILQAKRLQLLPNSGLCGVAGGALGVIAATVYLHLNNFGSFEATLIGAVTPVLFGAIGIGVGRFIPARAGMARLEDENRIGQKLVEVSELILRLSADLDALPVQKGTTARRAVLTREINDAYVRKAELQQQLKQVEEESFGGVFVRQVEPAPRALPELEPPASPPEGEEVFERPELKPAPVDIWTPPPPDSPRPPERNPQPPAE
ncbi:hypothetical protein AB4Y45_33975 [Paraburkholderia sp. EG287A]|uniref:hypothetical protein n=1 Tax=Paraburkholderia sp. EG287A TaxID=3237012 RepID=UPI0034D35E49